MTKENMYDLLLKYLAGDISTEEKRILFQQLKENEELRKEAAGIQNLSALVSMANENDTASDRAYQSFVNMRKKRTLLLGLRKMTRYAAIVCFSVLSTYLLMNYAGNKKDKFIRYQEFSTPAGQRAKVLLADGSEIWLNANSRLRYPERFDSGKREVELHGEAFFEVKKATEKPFIVKTDRMDIQVTGTKFNVNAYDTEEYYVTSLVEGTVSVSCAHDKNSSHTLSPRQQIAVSEHSFQISSFENTDFMAWKEGLFVFDDVLLTDIIKKLELYYDVSIIVQNDRLKNLRYTGKFRQRDGVESILQKFQIIYPFKYTKDDDKNLIVLQ